jgi:short-subunit dehydrogenase
VPGPFWQSAEAVVDEALRAFEADRGLVVTGWHNKLAVALGRLAPASWLSRITGLAARLAPQSAAH